jgi:hypothetical protein
VGIKRALAKAAKERFFSKSGVKRYRDEQEELEELEEMKAKAKRKRIKRPKTRKPKLKDIEFYKDVQRREKRAKGNRI